MVLYALWNFFKTPTCPALIFLCFSGNFLLLQKRFLQTSHPHAAVARLASQHTTAYLWRMPFLKHRLFHTLQLAILAAGVILFAGFADTASVCTEPVERPSPFRYENQPESGLNHHLTAPISFALKSNRLPNKAPLAFMLRFHSIQTLVLLKRRRRIWLTVRPSVLCQNRCYHAINDGVPGDKA